MVISKLPEAAPDLAVEARSVFLAENTERLQKLRDEVDTYQIMKKAQEARKEVL